MRILHKLLTTRAYLAAITVLAIGIGVSTAVFSLTYAVVIRPLPFPNQDTLKVIWKSAPKSGVPFLELAYPELNDLRTGVPAFDSVALMPTTLYGYGKVIRIGKHEPVQVESAPVSHDFFRTLGVHPMLGRDFNDADEHLGSAPVVILSYATWQTRFHEDRSIVGQQITLNNEGFTVIGIAPREVDFPRGVGLWTPLGVQGDLQNRANYYLQAIARTKPNYTAVQVLAQTDRLFKRLALKYPQFYPPGQGAVVTPLPEYWTGSSRLQLLLSLGASFLLLFAACITASNLFLSRTLVRKNEIATRSALGASGFQIAKQFLLEGTISGLLAAAAGSAIAGGLIRVFAGLAPPDIPRLQEASINWHVFAFAALLSVFAATACSLAPALASLRLNAQTAMREGSNRLASSRGANRMQATFTVAQTATSVVLLAASLMVVVSVRAMMRTDTGFSHKDAVTMNLALHGADAPERRLFYTKLLDQLKQSPAVSEAGGVLVRPLEGSIGWDMSYESEFDLAREQAQLPVSNFEVITPGYFSTVGTPLLAGRGFTFHDSEASRKVVIISQGLAENMRHQGHEPLGTRIRFGRRHDGEWWTIIGITGSTRYRGVTTRDEDIYVNYLQSSIPVNYLVVRGPGSTRQLIGLVRQAVAEADPTQAIASVATIGDLVQKDTARQRFNMFLLLSFGLAALLLTAAGAYSVISEMVSLKRREIAIRLALGSDRIRLVYTFAAGTMLLVAVGEAIGVAAAVSLGQLVSGLLYQVSSYNARIFALTVFAITTASALAAFTPAWIASGESPRAVLQ